MGLVDQILESTPLDWALDADGDLVVPIRYTYGLAGVAQSVRVAVQMVRGEWFEDLGVGVPYFVNDSVTAQQAILGQKFDAVKARESFRREILAVRGVTEIISLGVVFDATTRGLTISVSTRTVFGDTPVDTLVLEV